MVVFTCNHCGESLQKPKVEKHYASICRKPKFVCCVDCLKDFRNEEYVGHTKCVTEQERYSAKGSLQNATKKGEVKQESWMEMINSILNTNTSLSPPQKELLKFLSGFDNVPRKKQKLINYVCSSSGRKVRQKDIEAIWDVLEKHKNQEKTKTAGSGEVNGKEASVSENSEKNEDASQDDDAVGTDVYTPPLFDNKDPEVSSSSHKKKNKRKTQVEKKEETHKKHKLTSETVSEATIETNEKFATNGTENKKSKKKRKIQAEGDVTENGIVNGETETIPKKKKKKAAINTEEMSEKSSFSFHDAIINVLKVKKSMSLEKLEKKVLNAYSKHEGILEITNQIRKKYKKKLRKLPNVQITESTATLLDLETS